MSKAFTKEDDARDEDLPESGPALPEGAPNYLTPAGFERLQAELRALLESGERPRRARYLAKSLELAQVVEPVPRDQAFFGATVTYADGQGDEHTVSIVGLDEAAPEQGTVSWISPLARALLGKREGDSAELRTPAGKETLEVLEITYE
jgi:transcription elongation factor GreB